MDFGEVRQGREVHPELKTKGVPGRLPLAVRKIYMEQEQKFVRPNDPVLSQRASEVTRAEIDSPETKEAIERMLKVAYGEQKDSGKPLLVGLAAPQIGISKRIILVDVGARGKGEKDELGDLGVYIDPVVIKQSEEENEWYEGCFSTDRVCGIVSRPTKITIRALTRDGQVVEEEHE